MKFEIKHRYSNEVLFSIDIGTLKLAVEAAVKSKADLSGANLSVADLSWANLSGVDLYRANLSGADLYEANLSGADLSTADLSGADLSWANLSGADLSRANLSRADLSWANLSGADLSTADLSGADLYGVDLSGADLYGYISVGPIGSRKSYLWTRWEDKGFMVRTGCFGWTLDEFEKAVKEEHGSVVHKTEYAAAINLLEARMKSSKSDWEKCQKEKKP